MSDIKDEMLEEAWKLYLETSKKPEGAYRRDIWNLKQLGEHLFQYNTGYQYKDGSMEGSYCHVVWYENGKLTSLKTIGLWNGYDIGPAGPLYEDVGNNIYEYLSPERRQLSYREYVPYMDKTGVLVRISPKGIEEIKSDLSNLPEEDFLRLYRKLAKSYKYQDVLKERTFDITGKWGNSKELLPQRMKRYSELVYGDYFYEYRWLQQSPEDKAKLIELINNENISRLEINENRLSNLKGVSISDLLRDNYSKVATLAAQAYDCSHLSGLLQVAADAPNTPAFDLISARYRETYSDEIVNGITERADEIIKLPYKKMFFETITKDNINAPEANFLDEFTDRIRTLAMTKYGQNDWDTSISKAGKNPEFMKETDHIWNEMFKEVDKYATYKPNNHNNFYIRQMFPEKAELLHEFVVTQKTDNNFTEVLDETIKYYRKIGKMQAAIMEYSKDNKVSLNGNLHFDLVNAGIETKQEAKRCLDIWQAANERPDRYGSPYNDYSIRQIASISKSNVMQDWMYPIMMNAVREGGLTLSEERIPSERTLFDCCKAWKICPTMPQRLAKEIGTYSLRGRMLAGAIFEKMVEESNTTLQEWRENKELHQNFYEEFNRAQKMTAGKAFKQYIPNTSVNRKRLVGIGMEEKGVENTPENFKALYGQMRKKGIFEKILADPKEAKTTFSSKLLVETARKKFNQSR